MSPQPPRPSTGAARRRHSRAQLTDPFCMAPIPVKECPASSSADLAHALPARRTRKAGARLRSPSRRNGRTMRKPTLLTSLQATGTINHIFGADFALPRWSASVRTAAIRRGGASMHCGHAGNVRAGPVRRRARSDGGRHRRQVGRSAGRRRRTQRGSHTGRLDPIGLIIGSAQNSGVRDISTCEPRRVNSPNAVWPDCKVGGNGLCSSPNCS